MQRGNNQHETIPDSAVRFFFFFFFSFVTREISQHNLSVHHRGEIINECASLPIFKLDIFLHASFEILRRYTACFPPPRHASMNGSDQSVQGIESLWGIGSNEGGPGNQGKTGRIVENSIHRRGFRHSYAVHKHRTRKYDNTFRPQSLILISPQNAQEGPSCADITVSFACLFLDSFIRPLPQKEQTHP